MDENRLRELESKEVDELTDEELLELIAEDERRRISGETTELQRVEVLLEFLGQLPPDLWDLIDENGNKVKKRRSSKNYSLRIAVAVIVFFIMFSTWLIIDPRPAIAVRKAVNELTTVFKGDSVEIGVSNYPQIPEGFTLYESSTHTKKYINGEGNYINLSIYSDDFTVRADNEDCDVYEETEINGKSAVRIVKKGVTTIYIYGGNEMIKLESDLSEEETESIAETID